jgi:hypothetical protein
MKIAATRDRAEVLLRNQEKLSSLSSLSTGMISGDSLVVIEIINHQISSIIRLTIFFCYVSILRLPFHIIVIIT